MSHDIIQANYDTLEEVAQIFAEASQGIEEMLQEVRGGMENLRDEWIGLGSDAFFSKMGDEILPATVRLRDALVEASATTRIISITIITAEKEAASLFKNEGSPDAGAKRPASTEAPIPPEESGDYVLGPPKRPEIQHDNGFLDKYDPEEPTLQDYLQLAEWRLFLEGSKAATKAGVIDLDDANDAYEHFLDGKGVDRVIDIDEYYAEDAAGQKTLELVIQDAQRAAEDFGQNHFQFQISSSRTFAVGSGDLLPKFHPDRRFKYPETENWQKAIGAHQMWTSADVEVSTNPDGTRRYKMELTVHVEDRFNFNPGMQDIATGIPDLANGRFEVTGLAHQYMNYGETTRTIEWDEGQLAGSGGGAAGHDNRGDRIGPNTSHRPRPAPRDIRDDHPRTRPPIDEATEELRTKVQR